MRRYRAASHLTGPSLNWPEHLQVTLDHRNLKTPAGTKLAVPKDRRLLAILIANEWENQDEVLKQHTLPMVRASSHVNYRH